jgi:5,5'-dehydrodivanillate O-demethylase
VEGDSIRCRYHGWKYDGTGQCVEQPGEDGSFAGKVKISSYPTKEYLGLIFAFLGEGEPPPLRRYHELEGPGVLEVYTPEYWPCNYFNRIDNACDAAHVVFTHRDSRLAVNYRPELPTIHAEETEYGVRTNLMRGKESVTALHFHMPNTNHFRTSLALRDPTGKGSGVLDRLLWRIPVDDENCVSFPIDFAHLEGDGAREYQKRRTKARLATTASHTELGAAILAGRLQISDAKDQPNLKNLTSLEDYVTQVGQGPIPDRSQDRLGRIDAGVFLLRKIWERELTALAKGFPLKQWTIPKKLPQTAEVPL